MNIGVQNSYAPFVPFSLCTKEKDIAVIVENHLKMLNGRKQNENKNNTS